MMRRDGMDWSEADRYSAWRQSPEFEALAKQRQEAEEAALRQAQFEAATQESAADRFFRNLGERRWERFQPTLLIRQQEAEASQEVKS